MYRALPQEFFYIPTSSHCHTHVLARGIDTSLRAKPAEGSGEKCNSSGAGLPVFDSLSHLLLSVRLAASYLSSLDPSFLTCTYT